MLYAILGRAVWTILRGYFRHRFPHAGRTAALGGTLVAAAAVAVTAARRSNTD